MIRGWTIGRLRVTDDRVGVWSSNEGVTPMEGHPHPSGTRERLKALMEGKKRVIPLRRRDVIRGVARTKARRKTASLRAVARRHQRYPRGAEGGQVEGRVVLSQF